MDNLNKDLKLKKVRERLNAEKIKLWLPPYTTEDKEKGIVPEDLIAAYSRDFKFTAEEVAELLEELRLHSLCKLAERDKFMTQGLATLRVKVACPIPSESSSRTPIPIECSLSISGSDLKALVASSRDGLSADLLKLICKGRVLKDTHSLEEQDVKHGSDVMAMVMSASEAKLVQQEAEVLSVEKMRRTAELLSNREDDDRDFDIQITDQRGRPINIPREEKKALTLAMTLHEKGRSAVKQKRVSQALLLLLEADSEFSKCSADILQCVDNYGILCLDIVWCYLLLKNLDQLPDAERRLKTTEDCFRKSYGEKMERLTAIKGGTGTEQALFMRLYLLQGVVAFHKGNLIDAQNLFRRAEFVLTLLHVDEDQLNQVMIMGFSEKEARLGLRAKSGNIHQAVAHIMEKRKEIEENNKKSNAEWKKRILERKLGKTAAGQPVDVEAYNNLVTMDFPKGAAAESLRQCNNDLGSAIEYLQVHPELFTLPDPEKKDFKITDKMIEEIAVLGYDKTRIREALQHHRGDIEKAVEQLMNGGHASTSSISDVSIVSASESESTSSESSSSECTEEERSRKRKEREELASFVSDINTDANDHLDLTLVDEREILTTYQGLADSMATTARRS